jgi:hypothetical protein
LVHVIDDLPAATLGQAASQTIVLNATVAGNGWFIDRSIDKLEACRHGPQGPANRRVARTRPLARA